MRNESGISLSRWVLLRSVAARRSDPRTVDPVRCRAEEFPGSSSSGLEEQGRSTLVPAVVRRAREDFSAPEEGPEESQEMPRGTP